IAVDPWRCERPDGEGRIDPAQAGCGGVSPPERGQNHDQGADDPTVPVTGISGRAIDPGRKEEPHSAKNGEGTCTQRRMSIDSARSHGFLTSDSIRPLPVSAGLARIYHSVTENTKVENHTTLLPRFVHWPDSAAERGLERAKLSEDSVQYRTGRSRYV